MIAEKRSPKTQNRSKNKEETNVKKIVSIMLVIAMLFSGMLMMQTEAATIVRSGSCGDSVSYKLDSEGVLTIYGSGSMDNYTSTFSTPFYNFNNSVRSVIVESSVTRIGSHSFMSMKNPGLRSAFYGIMIR